MPKYGSLKADEIKGLVAYIRTLKKIVLFGSCHQGPGSGAVDDRDKA